MFDSVSAGYCVYADEVDLPEVHERGHGITDDDLQAVVGVVRLAVDKGAVGQPPHQEHVPLHMIHS